MMWKDIYVGPGSLYVNGQKVLEDDAGTITVSADVNQNVALVTSGTATLETALFKIPEVVCYKGSWISYQIAKRVITLKYISLVNLILDKLTVKEFIQHDLNVNNLNIELGNIINDKNFDEDIYFGLCMKEYSKGNM